MNARFKQFPSKQKSRPKGSSVIFYVLLVFADAVIKLNQPINF